jgi:hypothetical protein
MVRNNGGLNARAWKLDMPQMSWNDAVHGSIRSTELIGRAAGEAPVVMVAPAGRQTVWWMLTVVLAVLATAVIARQEPVLPAAVAQANMPVAGAGARGIYAFTGQLTAKTYGLFMMDVDNGTVWCYELQRGASGEPQMKLAAARSWIYDRFLEEFNVADPVPTVVKTLVQQQRSGQGAPGAAVMASPAPSEPPAPASTAGGSGRLPSPVGRP